MTEADFGFDELAWTGKEESTTKTGPVVEKLPDVRIPETATKEDKVKILESRYPEFQPLARDFVDLQKSWLVLNAQARSEEGKDDVVTLTKLQALSAYLGSIAMYFAVLASDCKNKIDSRQITSLPPNELRDHAIIDNLMKSRQIWDETKHLNITKPRMVEIEPVVIAVQKPVKTKAAVKDTIAEKKAPSVKVREEKDRMKPEKKKREKSKLLDLQTLLAQPAEDQEEESDFGDEAPLTVEEAAEKAKKKKSLRFYTSQIAQKANKRGAASRDAGGDDDVPRKERLRDRQERLLKDAEKRGQQKATGDEELGGDDDDVSVDMGAGDEYYQSMVAQNSIKKAAKQARAEAYAEAARNGGQVFEEEQVGPDGKRAITYAIEKNKGLMPKRKKDVRNPRVKKRKKYDEKKKKLASIRPVYKGGQKGAYGGEATGIKTNIVKSVKL
jgi:U3 small nucleolar RNA-associated protein 3